MESTGELVVSVSVDTTEIEAQIAELKSLLKSELEGVPDDFISSVYSYLPAVLDDVVFANTPTALSTGLDIVHRVRFGAKYERFTAAIRAGKLDANFL